MFDGEQQVKIVVFRKRHKRGFGRLRLDGKAKVKPVHNSARCGIELRHGRYRIEFEIGDQAVLQGTPHALYTPFCLRRMGHDEIYP